MAGKPQPTSAAALAREFYRTHAHLTTTNALLEAFVAAHPDTAPDQYDGLRRAWNRELTNQRVQRTATAPPEPTLSVEAEEKEPWRVEEGHYTWQTGSGYAFRLSVSVVDELFYAFSKHGLNLTQTQVINKFNLKTWQWNSLKSRLGLVKLANVFSPWTEENTPKQELAAMMEAKMNARFENRGLIVEQSYTNSTNKQYLKVIAAAEQNTFLNQKVLAELADRFPEAKVRWMLRGPVAPTAAEHLLVTIADIHLGANVKGLALTPDYSIKQLYAYADEIIARTNAAGAKRVWLVCPGDVIESFSGLNHIDSWKNLELHGAQVLAAAYEFFEYLLARINNVAGLLAVGGNHDRAAANNKEENSAQIAQALFYFLKRSYGNLVDVEYQTEVLARHIDGIRYVLTHGGKGNTGNDSKVKDLFYNYGDSSCFTVLLTAHLHSRMVKLDSHNKRHIVVPSLFTGNPYSENLGFTSTAGFLLISNNGHGYPRVVDETLHPTLQRAA